MDNQRFRFFDVATPTYVAVHRLDDWKRSALPVKTEIQQELESKERVEVLIDCSNLDRAAEKLNCRLNYEALKLRLGDNAEATCFLIEDEIEAVSHQTRDWLRGLGYKVVAKPLKQVGLRRKGNVDVEMALHLALLFTNPNRPNLVILSSGDGDFIVAVELVQSVGIPVVALAFEGSMSGELKKAVDEFIPIGWDLLSPVTSTSNHRRWSKWPT